MTTAAYQRERGRLAEALKALRVGAGLSGARLAEMLGWQQSKVPEIETRKQLPSEDDIAASIGAVGAAPEKAGDLLAMLRGARVEYAAWKDAYRESGPAASRPATWPGLVRSIASAARACSRERRSRDRLW